MHPFTRRVPTVTVGPTPRTDGGLVRIGISILGIELFAVDATTLDMNDYVRLSDLTEIASAEPAEPFGFSPPRQPDDHA